VGFYFLPFFLPRPRRQQLASVRSRRQPARTRFPLQQPAQPGKPSGRRQQAKASLPSDYWFYQCPGAAAIYRADQRHSLPAG